jgi:nucleotide-binding universal stress UspA family protein
MRTAPVVAGTDGTAQGEAAVRWAAREAVRRDTTLRIVYAYSEAHAPHGIDRHLAQIVLDAAAVQARAAAGYCVAVQTAPVAGDPVTALLAQRDACLLVLGSRTRTGISTLLPGSVGRRVAMRAAVPVLVVRGRTAAGGPVVIGVDDSPAAELVLATGFQEAALRDAPLAVVRTYASPAPAWTTVDLPALDLPTVDGAEHERLEEQLAPWRARHPRVEADAVVSPGAAAPLLIAVSCQARLIVVGSRSRGPIANALLGSTGMELLHHANCPVLITRPAPAVTVL